VLTTILLLSSETTRRNSVEIYYLLVYSTTIESKIAAHWRIFVRRVVGDATSNNFIFTLYRWWQNSETNWRKNFNNRQTNDVTCARVSRFDVYAFYVCAHKNGPLVRTDELWRTESVSAGARCAQDGHRE